VAFARCRTGAVVPTSNVGSLLRDANTFALR
jgi:hypothetical protein